MTALALREDQTSWDEAQLAVLRSIGIDEDVSAAELQAFLHECQMRRLDPFTRQIYLLGRWNKQKRRKVYRSQTSIDGFRLIARRAADEAKESIEYEDTLWCGQDGKWADVWTPDGAPFAAKVTVLRGGRRFPAVARFSGYVQLDQHGSSTGLWAKMSDNQIAKCAEALSLRKAFPEELGSLYTDDEMAQADNPSQAVPGHVEHDEPRTERPAAATDQPWLQDAIDRASAFPDAEAGRKLWRDVAAKVHAGQCTTEDAAQLGALIKARNEDLAAMAGGDIVEGEIVAPPGSVYGLDPEDPWAAAVESITGDDDAKAARADLKVQAGNGSITRSRELEIGAAIEARLAEMKGQAAA